jgi:hypothetical protein
LNKWDPTEEELALWRDGKTRHKAIQDFRYRTGFSSLVDAVKLFEGRTSVKLRTEEPSQRTEKQIEELLYASVFGTNAFHTEIQIGDMRVDVKPDGRFVAVFEGREVKGRFKVVLEYGETR